MSGGRPDGGTRVAGVIGAPVSHSLSPLIHNAWLAAARVDGVYVPFAPIPQRFEAFVESLRGGALCGLNVTAPFKVRALALADEIAPPAVASGAANLLLYRPGGTIEARNTDGVGLLAAFAEQAPSWRPEHAPVVILGAGGAARGAVEAMTRAGASVRIVNRTKEKARTLCGAMGASAAFGLDELASALEDAGAMISAAPLDLGVAAVVAAELHNLPASATVMDMVYSPLETLILHAARERGLATVDGLAMLIGQARPSFEALFGAPAPADFDVRALAEAALRARG